MVIDGAKFKVQDLIDVFNCFDDVVNNKVEKGSLKLQNPTKQRKSNAQLQHEIMTKFTKVMQAKFGTSIRHLCLSNISVTNVFIKYLSNKLLNKLYSLELTSVKCTDVP